jgi:hypothetical protein
LSFKEFLKKRKNFLKMSRLKQKLRNSTNARVKRKEERG